MSGSRRLRACVEAFPEAGDDRYDPRCCRFPKVCSPYPYQEAIDAGVVTDADLEPDPQKWWDDNKRCTHVDPERGRCVRVHLSAATRTCSLPHQFEGQSLLPCVKVEDALARMVELGVPESALTPIRHWLTEGGGRCAAQGHSFDGGLCTRCPAVEEAPDA